MKRRDITERIISIAMATVMLASPAGQALGESDTGFIGDYHYATGAEDPDASDSFDSTDNGAGSDFGEVSDDDIFVGDEEFADDGLEEDDFSDDEQHSGPEIDYSVQQRTLKVNLSDSVLFGASGEQLAENVGDFWDAYYDGRELMESLEGGLFEETGAPELDEDVPLAMEVSGMLPGNIQAVAEFTEYESEEIYSEEALVSFDLHFEDENGATYTPDSDLTVTIGGTEVREALEEGQTLLLYDFKEDVSREDPKKPEDYKASATVYRDLEEEVGKNKKEIEELHDRLFYKEKRKNSDVILTEDKQGLDTDRQNKTVSFALRKPSVQMILTAVQPKRTLDDGSWDGSLTLSAKGMFSEDTSVTLERYDSSSSLFQEYASACDPTGYEALLAYEITFNSEAAGEYTPDRPVSAVISDLMIEDLLDAGRSLTLLKLKGDGSVVRVADADFAGDSVSFEVKNLKSLIVAAGSGDAGSESTPASISDVLANDDQDNMDDIFVDDEPETDAQIEEQTEEQAGTIGSLFEEPTEAETEEQAGSIGSLFEESSELETKTEEQVTEEPATEEIDFAELIEDLTEGETEEETTESVPEKLTEVEAETETEKVTEVVTEAATEFVTEKTTESVTEEPAEAATETTTESLTEEVTEAATESVTEALTEEATETVTEEVTEKNTETLTEKQTEEEIVYPAQSFTGNASGVSVAVEAPEGAFPKGTTMQLKRVWDRDAISEIREGVAKDFVDVKRVQLVDITFIDADGAEIEPKASVSVSMIVTGISDEQEALVVHVDNEGELNVQEADVTNSQSASMELTFDAGSFSLYAVVVTETIETRYIDAKGNTYAVEVGYGQEAGIPAGAELRVSELTGEEAEDYISRAAEAMDLTSEQVAYAKPLDISIVANDEEVQPKVPVQVSVKLLDAPEAGENEEINVVHFGDAPEVLDCALDGKAVTFESDGFSVYVVVQTIKEQILTASDGRNYKVTVEYDSTSGIPVDAELQVSELNENNPYFTEYIEKTAETLGKEVERLAFAHAFDIKLVDPESGEKYQPGRDVKVSIELLTENIQAGDELSVVHFKDDVNREAENEENGEDIHGETLGEGIEAIKSAEAEVLSTSVVDGGVEFMTDGFSVYVVIKHEGDDTVEEPRVMFHYISEDFKDNSAEGFSSLGTNEYAAKPFRFLNSGTANSDEDPLTVDYQTSQVVRSEMKLEMIANPPTKIVQEKQQFFYGWYVVNHDGEMTVKGDSYIKYIWPATDELVNIPNECYIKIDPVKGCTVGQNISWYIGIKNNDTGAVEYSQTPAGRGILEEDGCIHVYLAPVYEDFYFVNFHMGSLDSVQALQNSYYTRKLLVFGSSDEANVRISDVICPSTDPQHLLFVGWQTKEMADDDSKPANQRYIKTVDISTGLELNADSGGIIYTVTKTPVTGNVSGSEVKTVDLYPYFEQARWLNFSTGQASNGSSYVSPRFRVTNDSGYGTYFDQAELSTNGNTITTQRNGYNMEGWYINAVQANSIITNMTSSKDIVLYVTDPEAKASQYSYNVETVDGKTVKTPNYENDAFVALDGYVQVKASLTATKLINADGTICYPDTVDGTVFKIRNENHVLIEGEKEVEENNTIPADYQNDVRIASVTYTLKTESGTQTKTVDIFQITKGSATNGDGGRLYFLQGLDDLTVEANWQANTRTSYKVVIWKQKVTDKYYYTDAEKNYDFEAVFTSNVDEYTENDTLVTSFTGSFAYTDVSDDNKIKNKNVTSPLDLTNPTNLYNQLHSSGDESFTSYDGFHYARNDRSSVTLAPDGTTVYNVYYDREKYSLTFQTDSNISSAYMKTDSDSGTQYAFIQGENGGQVVSLTKEGNNWIIPIYGYVYDEAPEGVYGKVGDKYYLLEKKVGSYSYNRTGYTYTKVTSNNGTQYGVVNGKIQRVYRNNNNWRVTDSWNGTVYKGYRYTRSNSDNYDVYNGTRYTLISGTAENNKSGFQDTQEQTGDDLFGYEVNDKYFQLRVTENNITYTYVDDNGITQPYTGSHYSRSYEEIGTEVYGGDRYTNTTGKTVYVITALYGQSISKHFPIAGYTNGQRWDPQSTPDNTNDVIVYMETMPAKDETYKLNDVNRPLKTMNYYVEALPDTQNTVSAPATVYHPQTNNPVSTKNKQFILYNSIGGRYNACTPEEDFVELEGFTRLGADSQYEVKGTGTNAFNAYIYDTQNDGTINFYYTRNARAFTFNVNYPDEYGVTFNGVDQNDANVVKSENLSLILPYQTQLSWYGYDSNTEEWYYGPQHKTDGQELKVPDHYIFEGWYEDSTGKVPFNFSSTMPAANKVVYAKWTPVKVRIMVDPNGAEIDHIDHTGARYSAEYYEDDGVKVKISDVLATIGMTEVPTFKRAAIPAEERPADTGYNKNQSTFFNNKYHETISEYTVTRRYVPITDKAAAEYEGTIYYYVNTQYNIGDVNMDADLRNALFMTEAELLNYYKFYYAWQSVYNAWSIAAGKGPVTVIDDFSTWKQTYHVTDQKYRICNGQENYKFLGWFEVNNLGESNESVEKMPYIFSTPVEEKEDPDPKKNYIALRALWRLDGGYQIRYHADYEDEVESVMVNGTMGATVDPPSPDGRLVTYADLADTTIYKAPVNITVGEGENMREAPEYIFRGYRLVTCTYDESNNKYNRDYTPLEGEGVFYDPGEPFVVRAEYADNRNVIHFQAVYEKREVAYRRPSVANLILDAGSGGGQNGYITDGSGDMDSTGRLTELANSKNISKVGDVGTVLLDADNEQLVFGDLQANLSLPLYQYATELLYPGGIDTGNEDDKLIPEGKNYFAHPNGYLLLGFDEADSLGDYVAAYPADSVIAVTRETQTQPKTLYALWEPMVYITFKNDSDKPLDKNGNPLTGSNYEGKTIVITLEPESGEETLDIINKKLGMYARSSMTGQTSFDVLPGQTLTLAIPKGAEKRIKVSGDNELGAGWLLSAEMTKPVDGAKLVSAGEGTSYTEVRNEKHFAFKIDSLKTDAEGLEVTFTAKQNPHTLVLDDNFTGGVTQEIYFQDTDPNGDYYFGAPYQLDNPNTYVLHQFKGWAISEEEADLDKITYEKKETIQNLEKFFKENGSNVPLKTLYAVWEDNREAQTVYILNKVPTPGNQTKEFTYTVGFSGEWSYSIEGSGSDSGEIPLTSASFTLKNEEYLKIVTTHTSTSSGSSSFMQMAVEKYNAEGDKIGEYPSIKWVDSKHAVQFYNMQFFVEQDLADTYTTTNELTVYANQNILLTPDGSYRVNWTDSEAGGTVEFTNTIDTYTVNVEKTLVSNTATGRFNYTWSYTLDNNAPVTGSFELATGVEAEYAQKELVVPSNAVLTVTEELSDPNYMTSHQLDDGAATDGKQWIGTVSENHHLTFVNTLRSVQTSIYLVDQDKNKNINGTFSLFSEKSGYLGGSSVLYASASAGGDEKGRIFSGSLYLDSYTLTQKTIPDGHIALQGPAQIDISYDPDTDTYTVDSSDELIIGIYIASAGRLEIYVYNPEYTTVTVQKALVDELVETIQFSFEARYSYTIPNTTSELSGSETFNLTVQKTNPGEANKWISKDIQIPKGATLNVREKFANENAANTYDTTAEWGGSATSVVTAPSEDSEAYYKTVSSESPVSDPTTVSFINTRKRVSVTVTKDVGPGDTNSFSFTSKQYTPNQVLISNTTETFTLTRDTSGTCTHIIENIPIGAKLVVTESGADGYTTSVTAKNTEDETSYSNFTYTSADRKVEVGKVPSTPITVTFLNRKKVTITADSDSKSYDSTELTKNTYTNTNLIVGDTIDSVTVTGSQTEVGCSDNVPSAAVIKHGEEDVTGYYDITYENGTLEVTRRQVTITANDASRVYNGSALTEDGFVVKDQANDDSHTFTVVMTDDSTITDVGTQPNVIAMVDGIEVPTGVETAVGNNYLVTTVNGTLTVIQPVCKITDDNGALLYYMEDSQPVPAFFPELNQDVVNKLGNLYKEGETSPYDGSYSIKMLVPEYTLTGGIELPSSPTAYNVTLTTTGNDDTSFPQTDPATIIRGFDDGSMFTSNGTFTLTDIVLDGHKDEVTTGEVTEPAKTGGDGGLVNVASGTLNIMEGTVLRNSNASNSTSLGGAVYMGENTALVMTGGSITGNAASEGAAIYLNNGADLTMTGGSITGNAATGENGGAVNMNNAETLVNVSGAPVIYNNLSGEDQKNLVLSVNSDTVINVTGPLTGGDEGAKIGVYATAGDRHLARMDFGSFDSDTEGNAFSNNLDIFKNDRSSYLHGVESMNSGKICWAVAVMPVEIYEYEKGKLAETEAGQAGHKYTYAYYFENEEYSSVDQILSGMVRDPASNEWNPNTEGYEYRYGTAMFDNIIEVEQVKADGSYKVKGVTKEQNGTSGETLKVFYYKTNNMVPLIVKKEWNVPDSVYNSFVQNNREIQFAIKDHSGNSVSAYTADSTEDEFLDSGTLTKEDAITVADGENKVWQKVVYVAEDSSYSIEETGAGTDDDMGPVCVYRKEDDNDTSSENKTWIDVPAYDTGYLQITCNYPVNNAMYNEASRITLVYKDVDQVYYRSSVAFSEVNLAIKDKTYYIPIPIPKNADVQAFLLAESNKHGYYTGGGLSGAYGISVLLASGIGDARFSYAKQADDGEGSYVAYSNLAILTEIPAESERPTSDSIVLDATQDSLKLDVFSRRTLSMTNTAICKVVDNNGKEHCFSTLRGALNWARNNMKDADNHLTASIQVLMDYDIPTEDFLTDEYAIASTEDITFTTATEGTYRYEGSSQTATIRRKESGDSLFTSKGKLSFSNIILDGGSTAETPLNCSGKGGIIWAEAGELNINSGTVIRNSTAASGGAVYISDGASALFNGGSSTDASGNPVIDIEITGCSATNGGAVNVGGSDARLTFEGNVVIYRNFSSDGQRKNVVLDQTTDTESIIQTSSSGLSAGARIGVYVVGSVTEDPYKSHGQLGQDFGTYSNANMLNSFSNDRNGYYGEADPDHEGRIRWQTYLCKLTDKDGALLYKDQKGLDPAVYNTLTDAFADTKTTLYRAPVGTTDGSSYPYNPDGTNEAIKVEMLCDYEQPETDRPEVDAKREVILTTAATTARAGDAFLYTVTFANKETEDDKAVIKRAADGGSMFVNRGIFTLTDIILDGGSEDGFACSGNGGTVSSDGNASLTINSGVKIKNSKAAIGGGIYIGSNGTSFITGGSINSCAATENGAAVYLDSAAALTMVGGEISGNTVSDTVGAIEVKDGTSRINFAGTPKVYNNTYEKESDGFTTIQQKNIVLGVDSPYPTNDNGTEYSGAVINVINTTINETAYNGLSAGAELGVYIVDDQMNYHGAQERPFANYVPGASANLNSFKNDRRADLTGVAPDNGSWLNGKNVIVWSGVTNIKVVELGNSSQVIPGVKLTLGTDNDTILGGNGDNNRTSDSNGMVRIPWMRIIINGQQYGDVGSELVLRQANAVSPYIQPSGYWTLTFDSNYVPFFALHDTEKDHTTFVMKQNSGSNGDLTYELYNVGAHNASVVKEWRDCAAKPGESGYSDSNAVTNNPTADDRIKDLEIEFELYKVTKAASTSSSQGATAPPASLQVDPENMDHNLKTNLSALQTSEDQNDSITLKHEWSGSKFFQSSVIGSSLNGYDNENAYYFIAGDQNNINLSQYKDGNVIGANKIVRFSGRTINEDEELQMASSDEMAFKSNSSSKIINRNFLMGDILALKDKSTEKYYLWLFVGGSKDDYTKVNQTNGGEARVNRPKDITSENGGNSNKLYFLGEAGDLGYGPDVVINYEDQTAAVGQQSAHEATAVPDVVGTDPETNEPVTKTTYTLKAGDGNAWARIFNNLKDNFYYYVVETRVGGHDLVCSNDDSPTEKNLVSSNIAWFNPKYSYTQNQGRITINNRIPDYVARVTNDGGKTWTYHEYLINDGKVKDSSGSYIKDDQNNDKVYMNLLGAFNRANELTGDVVIELLKKGPADGETDDTLESSYASDVGRKSRYTLEEGFDFDGNNINSITLRTTQDPTWNSGETKFVSTIMRGYSGGSMLTVNSTFVLKNIILDGGSTQSTPLSCNGNGGIVKVTSGTLNIKSGTIIQNSKAVNGGAVSVEGSGTMTMSGGEINDCFADSTSGKGGAIYCNSTNVPSGGATIAISSGAINGHKKIPDSEQNDERTDTIFHYNALDGGGIYMNSGSLRMTGGEINDCTANANDQYKGRGGAICFNSYQALVVNNATIDGHKGQSKEYKYKHLPDNKELTIHNRNAYDGGGIFDAGNGSISVNNVVIRNCTTSDNGAGVMTSTKTFTFKNLTISACDAAKNGGGLNIYHGSANYGVATLKECTITGCNGNGGNGGGIRSIRNEMLILERCTLSSCYASGKGGGVYAECHVTFRDGTQISGNEVNSGVENAGGLYLINDKKLVLGKVGGSNENSRVTGNRARNSGSPSDVRLSESGGVNKHDSVQILCHLANDSEAGGENKGCLIKVANAKYYQTKFGTTTDQTDTDAFGGTGVSLVNRKIVSDDGYLYAVYDTDTSKIMWYGYIVCKITDESGTLLRMANGREAIFTSIKAAYDAVDTNNAASLKYADKDGGSTYFLTKYWIKMVVPYFESPESVDEQRVGNEYTLTTASAGDEEWPFNDKGDDQIENTADDYVYLDGQPKGTAIIKRQKNATFTNNMFTVKSGLTLNLTNIILDGNKDQVTSTQNGGIIMLKMVNNNTTSATLNIGEGAILQNSKVDITKYNGGAVNLLNANCTVNMSGGKIINCEAKSGGAVVLYNGVFNLTGGEISSNHCAENGGGVFVSAGTFNMKAGTITGNTADNGKDKGSGGGVYVNTGANFKMEIDPDVSGDRLITGNSARKSGGGVYVTGNDAGTSGHFVMSSGEISGNTAENGGAVYLNGAKKNDKWGPGILTYSGGKITGNTATSNGGGVFVARLGKMEISGNPNFGDNGVDVNGNLDFTGANIGKGKNVKSLTNGGQTYPVDSNDGTTATPRQDIFLDQEDSATPTFASLVVTGDLSAVEGEGSIWVWVSYGNKVPEASRHYKENQQFATFTTASAPSGLDAFRNAREDSLTTGSVRTDYLSAVTLDDSTTNIYWGIPAKGSRKVILRKVSNTYESLKEAKFTIYKGTSPVTGTDINGNNNVTSFESGTNGVFYIGVLDYGTYYLKETEAPKNTTNADGTVNNFSGNEGKWFCVIIDEYGAHMSSEGYLGTGDTAAAREAKAKADALADATAVQAAAKTAATATTTTTP